MSDPIYPPNPYGEQPQPPEQPPAYPAYGQQPPYGQLPASYDPAYAVPTDGPGRRPGSVTWAGIITIVMSALALVGFGLLTLGIAVARADVEKAIDDELGNQAGMEDLSSSDLTSILLVVMGVLIFWALCAIVLAVLTMKRHGWARILLVISASVTGVLCLVAITSLISLVPLVAAIAVIVLVFQKDANAWFAGRPAVR